MDRFAYDFLISLQLLGYNPKLAKWLYYNIPRPHFIFLLDVSPRTAWIRKRKTHPSHTLDFFTIARQKYLKLAEDLHIKVINTDHDTVQDTINKVISELKNKGFALFESVSKL
jgi:thymidylate kinase